MKRDFKVQRRHMTKEAWQCGMDAVSRGVDKGIFRIPDGPGAAVHFAVYAWVVGVACVTGHNNPLVTFDLYSYATKQALRMQFPKGWPYSVEVMALATPPEWESPEFLSVLDQFGTTHREAGGSIGIPKPGELERMHDDEIKREMRHVIEQRDAALAKVNELEAEIKKLRRWRKEKKVESSSTVVEDGFYKCKKKGSI